MKHYKDSENKLYGFEEGQNVPDGLIEISDAEHAHLVAENQAKHNAEIFDALTPQQKRYYSYPSIGDQLDAFWKGGAEAEAMRAQVMAVKAKYPK